MEWIVLILFVAAGVQMYRLKKNPELKAKYDKENKETIESLKSVFKPSKKENTTTVSLKVENIEDDTGDNFEGWFYDEVEDYVPINKTFKIKYKDGNGNITNREIYIKKFGKASFGGFILAHCFLRDANRTFRTDRILECIDGETGEYIKDTSNYLQEIYFNSEAYKEFQEQQKRREEKEIASNYLSEFLNKYDNLLKILVYIVRCDGSYNSREKAIIKELFENLEDDNELLTDKMLHKVLLDYTLPSIQAFKINLDKFIKENKYPQIDLVDIAANIISTQSTVHPNEQEVLDYFTKKFNIKNIDKKLKHDPKTNYDGITCPHCNSNYVHKKDKRIFKNHTNQRYQCQECNKIFSLKIEDE